MDHTAIGDVKAHRITAVQCSDCMEWTTRAGRGTMVVNHKATCPRVWKAITRG